MRFHFTFVSALLFAVVVLADRRRDHRRARHLNRALATQIEIEYNPWWAGSAIDKDNGSITSIAATFYVPIPAGPVGSIATAWVGIDGHSCYGGGLLQAGVDFSVTGGGPAYYAWFEFFPAYASAFNLTVHGNDLVRTNVTALSPLIGMATMENLSTGQSATVEITGTDLLCMRDGEFVVEDFPDKTGSAPLPLDDFGTVTFTDASITGPGGTFKPRDGIIMEIEQENTVLTLVTFDGDDLVITRNK